MSSERRRQRCIPGALILGVAAPLVACAPQALNGPAPAAYDLASLLDSIAVDSPWPGFDPRVVPLAVYDGSRTWMFRHPNRLAGFRPIDTLPQTQFLDGRHPFMRSNTSLEWDGVHTATLLLDTLRNPSPRAWARLAVHEAFHVFQREHYPTWGGNAVHLFVYPMTNQLNLELRRIETRALRAAMLSANPEDMACWTRAAMHARNERFGFIDSASAAYERGTEMLEGLADYVGSVTSGTPITTPAPAYPPEDVRARSYAIGAAMAALLDRMDSDWKTALTEDPNRHLDSLLEDAAATIDGRLCGPLPEQLHAIQEAAQADIRDLEARRAKNRSEFLDAPGWKLIIQADDQPLFPRRFDPLNVLRVTVSEVLHTRHIELGNEAGSVEVFDRTALTLGDQGHPLFAGVLRLTVTGLKAAPAIRDSSGAVMLEADGLAGQFRGAMVEANETERELVVVLRSRE